MLRMFQLMVVLTWVVYSCNSPSVDDEKTVDVADDIATEGDKDSGATSDTAPPAKTPPNILLIISDDLGLEASRCYGVGKDLAPMPVIDSLCERGMVFDNMWSAPVCSPTRAALLTGRYGYRTGIGGMIMVGDEGLSLDEWSIPRVLDANPALGYSHACIGKWHLGAPGDKEHPNKMGFSTFSGLLIGGVGSYNSWKETTDGVTQTITQYATSRHVDLALEWVNAQPGPWFLWLALISPHGPLHLPPAQLHTYNELPGTEEDIAADQGTYFRAMIQAMDTEIGRLFTGIGQEQMANTVVIYVGDNGTSGKWIEAPYSKGQSKGSLYQGGIHVPFVVAGPGVTSGRSTALTHVVDLFATILDLAGVGDDTPPEDVAIDGVSLAPILQGSQEAVHPWVLSELFGASSPNKSGKTVRDMRYKLMRLMSGNERFFDLKDDPYESSPLKAGELSGDTLSAYQSLGAILDNVGVSWD